MNILILVVWVDIFGEYWICNAWGLTDKCFGCLVKTCMYLWRVLTISSNPCSYNNIIELWKLAGFYNEENFKYSFNLCVSLNIRLNYYQWAFRWARCRYSLKLVQLHVNSTHALRSFRLWLTIRNVKPLYMKFIS